MFQYRFRKIYEDKLYYVIFKVNKLCKSLNDGLYISDFNLFRNSLIRMILDIDENNSISIK